VSRPEVDLLLRIKLYTATEGEKWSFSFGIVLSLKELISKDYAFSFSKKDNSRYNKLNGQLFLHKSPTTRSYIFCESAVVF
jgi:hypothetical protein